MELIKKFLSRRLLVIGTFGGLIPVLFHTMGISENITMASLALGAAYIGQRAIKG